MKKHKIVVLLLFLIHCQSALAQEIKKLIIEQTPLYYHYYKSTLPSSKLLIFLHGSASVYKGKTESKPVDIDELLESNKDFITTFQNQNFNIIVPVAYNEYNWLETKGMIYLDALVKKFF